MDNVVMFPFAKTKRMQEALASGTKIDAPKGYAETKARVARLTSRPKKAAVEDFTKEAVSQMTDALFKDMLARASAFGQDPKLLDRIPGNLADMHFLLNAFLVEAMRCTILPDEFQETIAIGDPNFDEAYRAKFTKMIEAAVKDVRKKSK